MPKPSILALLVLVLLPSTVYAAAGDLDPTFDGDGKVTTAIPMVASAFAPTTVRQADGKFVAAVDGTSDITVLRYNDDGSLDTGFDGDGIVSTPIGTSDRALGVALQSDGKIVVAGESTTAFNADIVVVRYDDDGTLDTSFDGDGIVTTPIGASTDSATSVRVQDDGKIVVAGRTVVAGDPDVAVVRYNDDGSLDTSFDGDGIVTTNIGYDAVEDLAIDPDTGTITVVGNAELSDDDLLIVRYTSAGALDTSFSSDGIITVDVGASDFGYGILTSDAGGVFVAAILNNQFAVLSYDATGTLDPGFDGDGIAIVVFGAGTEGATALVRQPDGKIVAAGVGVPMGNAAFALARFAVDGTLDPSFGTGGKVTTEFSAGLDAPFSLMLQPDGKLVAAGVASISGLQVALARYEGDPVGGATATPTPTSTATATPTVTTTPTPTVTATPPCAAAPVAGCRTPAQSAKSQLQAKDKSPDSKDQLQWKWSKGSVTTKADFGTPTEPLALTSYQLCIYGDSDGPTPTLLYEATIPAGGSCDVAHPRPCWKESTHGYSYKDKDRLAGGVAQLALKEGLSGSAKIQIKAGGAVLGDPTFPFVQPLTVQLHNSDGICWESIHSTPAAKNTDTPYGQFNDKAD